MGEITGQHDGLFFWTGKGQGPLDDAKKEIPSLPWTAGKEPILRTPVTLIPSRRRQHPRHRARAQCAEQPQRLTADSLKDPLLGKDRTKIIQ
jgi:hypothetical protein